MTWGILHSMKPENGHTISTIQPRRSRGVGGGVGEAQPRARTKLGTAKDVHAEMARVYRAVKNGDISPVDGCKMIYMLKEIAALAPPAQKPRPALLASPFDLLPTR